MIVYIFTSGTYVIFRLLQSWNHLRVTYSFVKVQSEIRFKINITGIITLRVPFFWEKKTLQNLDREGWYLVSTDGEARCPGSRLPLGLATPVQVLYVLCPIHEGLRICMLQKGHGKTTITEDSSIKLELITIEIIRKRIIIIIISRGFNSQMPARRL